MNDRQIPPHLRAIVDAGRSLPEPPAEARALLEARLGAILGSGAGLGGGGGRGADPLDAGRVGARLGAMTTAKLAGVFALGLAVGGGAVAGMHRAAERERIVYVDRIVQVPASPVPTMSSEAALGSPGMPANTGTSATPPSVGEGAAPKPARAATAPPSSSAARSRDTDLSAERALIERGRSAIARGDGANALAAIADHERRFPRGQLAEEREVLAVQALVIAHRVPEATERAARFRRTYPDSLLLPTVDEVLR